MTDASKATKVITNGEDIQVIFTGEESATEPTQVIPAPSTSSPAPHLSETFIGQKYKKFENLKLDDDEEPTKNTVVQPGNKKKNKHYYCQCLLIGIGRRKTKRKEFNR